MKTTAALLIAVLLAACAQPPVAETPLQRLSTTMRASSIVLLGEVHDNAAQHALRAQALRALLEGGARPALLMEQFDREHQAAIDRVLADPASTPDAVIAAGAPDAATMQGWDWAFYRPYIALALQYRLVIVAVNVSRADTRRVYAEGLAALGFDAAVPADIEATQAEAIADSHCGLIDTQQARRMAGAQVARDQFMARAIEANAARGVVLLAGNGHVRRDIGVPRWLTQAERERSVSIGLLEDGDPNVAAFDKTLSTRAQVRPDPCVGMRSGAPRS